MSHALEKHDLLTGEYTFSSNNLLCSNSMIVYDSVSHLAIN